MSSARSKWIAAAGVALIAAIVFATFVPVDRQIRTGLHWRTEHFLAYFVATSIVWLGWRRPLLVAGGLMIAAVLLEALQSLTPNHTSNFLSVLSGAGGVLAAVLLAEFMLGIDRATRRRASTARAGAAGATLTNQSSRGTNRRRIARAELQQKS